jgi:adenylate kinase
VNLIILGAPGSGKGTQAARVAKNASLRHVSTGDLLRDAVARKTELGKQVQGIMAAGKLVPDDVVLKLIQEAVSSHEPEDIWEGWILDGYPRTVGQAEALEDVLSSARETVEGVIVLEVDPEAVVERLSSRRSCVACKAVYNTLAKPPKKENVCDACGGELILREDDKPDTIRKRLDVYDEQTKPIINFYDERYDVHRVDGTKPIDNVTEQIAGSIGK